MGSYLPNWVGGSWKLQAWTNKFHQGFASTFSKISGIPKDFILKFAVQETLYAHKMGIVAQKFLGRVKNFPEYNISWDHYEGKSSVRLCKDIFSN
jgi:hypothetical protein